MRILSSSLNSSLLLRMGGAIAAIALMALLGMSVSWMVAETTQGSGEAINLAGSLRMQSWRMVSHALAAAQGDRPARAELLHAIDEFDATLAAAPIGQLAGQKGLDPLPESLAQVRAEWHKQIKPLFLALANGTQATPALETHLLLRARIDHFVAMINILVKHMEESTEAKIRVMRIVLGVALIVSGIVILLTIYLIHITFIQPMRELLALAGRAGQGDLSVRTPHTGPDEIGQLGRSFNLMAEDLQKLYQNLEERVAQKTAELTRSNQSLELLYHSIARLHGMPPNRAAYLAVLNDIEHQLGLGRGMVCLGEAGGDSGQVIASTLQAGDADPCRQADCRGCHGSRSTRLSITGDNRHILTLPLSDSERQYGVMILEVPEGTMPEAWRVQLLEALSRHIGIAIGAERRVEQERRLSLLEERAVIARELHDSLAQSLAYMKIQVSRLQAIRDDPNRAAESGTVMRELREGLNSAYRQLRELLSTFRLKIEGDSLDAALAHTVEEFTERGDIAIEYAVHLDRCALSPNEEIHVLHIIREALSNVLQHAQAQHAWVAIQCSDDGEVQVRVEDDGKGIAKSADIHHYGMTIMDERARSLHGRIRHEPRPAGGTRVSLDFRPSNRRNNAIAIGTTP